MSACRPASSKKRRPMLTYSVATRVPSGRSRTSVAGWSVGTARTSRHGASEVLAKAKEASMSTFASDSSIQSAPVRPTSNAPLATTAGISRGLQKTTRIGPP